MDQAREEYRKALIFSPDNQEVRLQLASLLMTSDTGEAHNYLHELADDDPTSGPISLMLARLDVNRHDVDAASEPVGNLSMCCVNTDVHKMRSQSY